LRRSSGLRRVAQNKKTAALACWGALHAQAAIRAVHTSLARSIRPRSAKELLSEGNLVQIAGRCLLRRWLRGSFFLFSCGPAENSQRGHNHFGDRSGRALAILVAPRLQAPFDENLLAFGHEPSSDLRLLVPGDTSHPFHSLNLLSLPALEGVVDGEREVGDALAVGRGFDLCISARIADEEYFVEPWI